MSAAAFQARYAAYSADLAVLAVPVTLVAWRPLQRIGGAWRDLEVEVLLALDRAFAAGHIALLDLANALRADAAFMAAMGDAVGAILAAIATSAAFAWAVLALYFVGFEASPWRATPGKRALGLRVAAVDGSAPGVGRVLLRFVAAGPSWLLLHLGHALVAFRDDGRAGHDLIAGTRVTGGAALPPWARAWLGVQLLAAGALLGWAAWTMAQAIVVLGL